MFIQTKAVDWSKFDRSVIGQSMQWDKNTPLDANALRRIFDALYLVLNNTPMHAGCRLLTISSRTHKTEVGPFQLPLELQYAPSPVMARCVIFTSGMTPVQRTQENLVAAMRKIVRVNDQLAWSQHPDQPAWRVHWVFYPADFLPLPVSSHSLYLTKLYNVGALLVEAAQDALPVSHSAPLSILLSRFNDNPRRVHPLDWFLTFAPLEWLLQPLSVGQATARAIFSARAEQPTPNVKAGWEAASMAELPRGLALPAGWEPTLDGLESRNFYAFRRELRNLVRSDTWQLKQLPSQ